MRFWGWKNLIDVASGGGPVAHRGTEGVGVDRCGSRVTDTESSYETPLSANSVINTPPCAFGKGAPYESGVGVCEHAPGIVVSRAVC